MTRQDFIAKGIEILRTLRVRNAALVAEVDIHIAWAEVSLAHRHEVSEFRVPGTMRDARQEFDRAAWREINNEVPIILRRQAE